MIYKVTHHDGNTGYMSLDRPPEAVTSYRIRGDMWVKDFSEVSPIDLVETFKAQDTKFGHLDNGWSVARCIAIYSNPKIEMIKLVRELQPGWSLVLCKDFCEWVWVKHTEIKPYLDAFLNQQEVERYTEFLGWSPVKIESAIWRSNAKILRLKKQPRRHAEVIKAWADGAEVQIRERSWEMGAWGEWRDISSPMFLDNKNIDYRVKPEVG